MSQSRRTSLHKKSPESPLPLPLESRTQSRKEPDQEEPLSGKSKNTKNQLNFSSKRLPSNEEVLVYSILVRQIADEFAKGNLHELNAADRSGGFRFQPHALQAIQEAVEAAVVNLYEDAYLCTTHAKRATLFDKDLILAKRIRGDVF